MNEFKLKKTLITGLGVASLGVTASATERAYTSTDIQPEWTTELTEAMNLYRDTQAKIESLKQDLASNAELQTSWQANPQTVLQKRGFSPDAQFEILKEEHRITNPQLLACTVTCACSGCCSTSSFAPESTAQYA